MYVPLLAGNDGPVFDLTPIRISVHNTITYADSKRKDECDEIGAMYIVGQQDEEVYGKEVSRGKRFV